jgi:hypothetical protein
MSIAEGVAARVAYKVYPSGVIDPNVDPVPGTDPGASDGQILRRVTSTIKLGKDTYQSAEIRDDRQIGDHRHGTRRGSGGITGELSGKTYQDLMAGAFRANWVASFAKTEAELTSVVTDNATAKFTFGGGDPVAEGFKVGDIIRATGLPDAANNAKNFQILAFGGTSNREVTVYPAPVTNASPDTSFTITRPGRRLELPSANFVKRRFLFEHYWSDIDTVKLFTESRIAGMKLGLPASGMATCEFPVVPRNAKVYDGSSAPFLTAPAAQTTTRIHAASGGQVRIGGTLIGLVSGGSVDLNLNPSSTPVWSADNLVPEIHLGRSVVTGQLLIQLQDKTYMEAFLNETELQVLLKLEASQDAAAQGMTIFLPRIKLNDDDSPLEGEGGLTLTMPFQALKYEGSAAGVPNTTLAIVDTESAA